ncbi:MAG: hypothetical protein ACRECA_13955 [Pseudolabrys sp.]
MITLALMVSLVTAWGAKASQREVGDWLVTSMADRFSEVPTTNVVAIRVNEAGVFLAVRCLRGKLSLAMGGEKYESGDSFLVKFRVDDKPVIDTAARAISEDVMQISVQPGMVQQMIAGREYALRISGETQNDYLFHAGRSAAQALGAVTSACLIDGK